MTKTSLIEFPCDFPVKIIGNNSPAFLKDVVLIVKKHFSTAKHPTVTHKLSQKNNFLAITATVYAENQEMLDAFYREITKHPDVKMVL